MSDSNGGTPAAVYRKTRFQRMLAQWDLQIIFILCAVFIAIFMYFPMYGMVMAFQQFKLGDFPGFSQWVGLKQFRDMIKDPYMLQVLRNTVVISGLKLLICFPLPIVFAVFLNEIRVIGFKKAVQTISYLPHFISWVIGAIIIFDFLSPDASGTLNGILLNLHIISKPIAFFGKAQYFWWISVFTDVWKELGWNAIIFVAAITSIDTEMYEAADMDGATRMQKIWYITTASIKPTIILLFVFTVGGILNANFDQIMQLTKMMGNGLIKETANVLDTYVYITGISQARFSYAAAVGLFKAVVNFILLLAANKMADKLGSAVF